MLDTTRIFAALSNVPASSHTIQGDSHTTANNSNCNHGASRIVSIKCNTECDYTTWSSKHDPALYIRPAATVRQLCIDGPLVKAPVVGRNRHHTQLP